MDARRSNFDTYIESDSYELKFTHFITWLENYKVSRSDLAKINFENLQFTQEQINYLSSFLIQNKTVEEIILSRNNINSNQFKILLDALNKNSTIQTLTLIDFGFTSSHISVLSEFLKTNKTLNTLVLSKNNFDKKQCEVLLPALTTHCSLINLSLEDTNLNETYALFLLNKILQENKTLKGLFLGKSYLQENTFKEFLHSLKQNITLKILSIVDSRLPLNYIELFTEYLKKNTSLTELHLCGTHLGPEHIKKLSEAIKVNSTLTNLDLDNNPAIQNGIIQLAYAINENIESNLTELSVINNSIQKEGYQALLGMIQSNYKIKKLYFFPYKAVIYDDKDIKNLSDDCKSYLEEIKKEINNNDNNNLLDNISLYKNSFYHQASTNPSIWSTIQNNKTKKYKIKNEIKYITILKNLLTNPCFKEKTGSHSGLDSLENILKDPTIPTLEKWPRMIAILKPRHGVITSYFPSVFGGRDSFTDTFYKYIEERNFPMIEKLANEFLSVDDNNQKEMKDQNIPSNKINMVMK